MMAKLMTIAPSAWFTAARLERRMENEPSATVVMKATTC